jgi:hypothetical protein
MGNARVANFEHLSFSALVLVEESGAIHPALVFQGVFKDWRFLKDKKFISLIDGKRITAEASSVDTDTEWVTTDLHCIEVAVFMVELELLEEISRASIVKVRAASVDFELDSFMRSEISELVEALGAKP